MVPHLLSDSVMFLEIVNDTCRRGLSLTTRCARDVENIPEAKLLTSDLCCNVSDTIITDCSPSSIIEHFQSSFTRILLFARQPHYTTRPASCYIG